MLSLVSSKESPSDEASKIGCSRKSSSYSSYLGGPKRFVLLSARENGTTYYSSTS
jgi:hypothetical protein